MSFVEDEIRMKVKELAEDIVRKHGLELFDVKYRRSRNGWTLTIYIDKLNGYVSIDDCERVSREIDPLLDAMDLIPHSYTLEVSSPGLNRPLRGPKDYKRFTGRLAKFVLNEPLEGRKVILGYIKIYNLNKKILTVEEKDTGKLFEIDEDNVSKANLEVEF